jgi:cell division GTPase FtsZ
VGKKSAEENRNNIVKAFEETDMIFITAVWAAERARSGPVVADIAKEAAYLPWAL